VQKYHTKKGFLQYLLCLRNAWRGPMSAAFLGASGVCCCSSWVDAACIFGTQLGYAARATKMQAASTQLLQQQNPTSPRRQLTQGHAPVVSGNPHTSAPFLFRRPPPFKRGSSPSLIVAPVLFEHPPPAGLLAPAAPAGGAAVCAVKLGAGTGHLGALPVCREPQGQPGCQGAAGRALPVCWAPEGRQEAGLAAGEEFSWGLCTSGCANSLE
jgi:hypothetical protein